MRNLLKFNLFKKNKEENKELSVQEKLVEKLSTVFGITNYEANKIINELLLTQPHKCNLSKKVKLIDLFLKDSSKIVTINLASQVWDEIMAEMPEILPDHEIIKRILAMRLQTKDIGVYIF
jgi:hypothetical protein